MIEKYRCYVILALILCNLHVSEGFSIVARPHINVKASAAPLKPIRPSRPSRLYESESDNGNGDVNGNINVNGNGNDNGNAEVIINNELEPKLYGQRWVQLAYLSLLALLSDWICFAMAAVPSLFESAYAGHTSASLIDIFLFTNVASCFIVTDVVNRFGLKNSIQFGAVLMTAGCLLRSGFQFLWSDWSAFAGANMESVSAASTPELVPYWAMLTGTVMVGFSQPFFQCTPPLLSAKWFGSDERATSTAVALNFNQIGIATAFLVGGTMATTISGLGQYLTLTSIICIAVTIGTLLQFQDKPPSPPSSSEIDKTKNGTHEEQEPPFFESVKMLFSTDGFTMPVIAFICSISITNIVGVS